MRNCSSFLCDAISSSNSTHWLFPAIDDSSSGVDGSQLAFFEHPPRWFTSTTLHVEGVPSHAPAPRVACLKFSCADCSKVADMRSTFGRARLCSVTHLRISSSKGSSFPAPSAANTSSASSTMRSFTAERSHVTFAQRFTGGLGLRFDAFDIVKDVRGSESNCEQDSRTM